MIASIWESVCFLEFRVKRINLSFILITIVSSHFRIKSKFVFICSSVTDIN